MAGWSSCSELRPTIIETAWRAAGDRQPEGARPPPVHDQKGILPPETARLKWLSDQSLPNREEGQRQSAGRQRNASDYHKQAKYASPAHSRRPAVPVQQLISCADQNPDCFNRMREAPIELIRPA